MRGEWCYFKAHFSPVQCERILSIVSRREASEAQIGTAEGIKSDNTFRRSLIRFVNKGDAELDYIFDELWKLALWANRDWFDFHITKLDYFQVAEYDSANAGEYKTHHDVFYMNGDPHYHRKLSCVVQLSDPSAYFGGDLSFSDVAAYPNPDELRQQGTVIFFPSFVRHAALPVVDGKRHSLAAWFDGPKWR